MGVVVEKIKELSLPLNMRIEDTIIGFIAKYYNKSKQQATFNHISIKFVEEDYKSKQHATFNYMNFGQINIVTSTILNGQKHKNEPNPDEKESFTNNVVVEEGYYGTKVGDRVYVNATIGEV